MSLTEIKEQIAGLAPAELTDLAQWWEEWRADEWDKQIERDILAGRFDALAEQANKEWEAGRCRPL